MKHWQLLIFSQLILITPTSAPAQAIWNGNETSDNSVVVPITRAEKGLSYQCSGALIAPKIVVTAAHCAVDTNGIITTEISVGSPSTFKRLNTNQWTKVTSVKIISEFSSTSTKVSSGDLALLTLEEAYEMKVPVRIATSTEVEVMKTNKRILRALGYGVTDESGVEKEYPQFIDGVLSKKAVQDLPNAGAVEFTNKSTCKGDSGGPVIAVTPQEIIYVGVLTGGSLGNNKFCTAPQSDGIYYAIFEYLNPYVNLILAAATSSMQIDILKIKSLEDEIAANEEKIWQLESQIISNEEEMRTLKLNLEKIKKQIPITIKCSRNSRTISITKLNANCPKGYQKKP